MASVLPLCLAAAWHAHQLHLLLWQQTEAVLSARCEQLADRLNAFHEQRMQLATELARLPDLPLPSEPPALVRGTCRLDERGTVLACSDSRLVGQPFPALSLARDSLEGKPHPPELCFLPGEGMALVYLAPVRGKTGRPGGAVAVWTPASDFWDSLRQSNSLAGSGSFALLLDASGIQLAHAFQQDSVFHPVGPLPAEQVADLTREQRYGPDTGTLLAGVQACPEQLAQARALYPDPAMFATRNPATGASAYAVARRLQTARWTLFFVAPEADVHAAAVASAQQSALYGAAIGLLAVSWGLLSANSLVRPIQTLSAATRRMAGGDLATRVEAAEGSAELLSLAADFNAMAAMLQSHVLELEASEAMFRDFLEAAPDGVLIVDRNGTVVRVNTQTEQLFGYLRSELVGQPVEMLVPDPLKASHRRHRSGYAEAPRLRAMGTGLDLYGRRKDGTQFPLEISLAPVGDLTTATIRDVTERRRLDHERRQLAAIVDSTADAVIGLDLDGHIQSWNEGAVRLFGYSAVEARGLSAEVLVPKSRHEEQREVLKRLQRGERVVGLDTIRRHKDGHDLEVSVTSSPVLDRRGTVIGFSKLVRDVAERKSAERALLLAQAEALAANRELEAFSYSVAHDLRAPLRGMNGFAELLLDGHASRLDETGRDWLQEISHNAKRMGQQIDGLLSLSRVTRSDLVRTEVSLSELAEEVVADLRRSEPERQVDVRIGPNLRASGDPRLLRSLLENLLGNAWKFTRDRLDATITFELRPEGFVVEDNGAGFDEEYAGKLFRPFQRLHRADEFPGTGIGLATVQRIVHRHSGHVWAHGQVGGGAKFFFRLAPKEGE